jgi:Icc protein
MKPKIEVTTVTDDCVIFHIFEGARTKILRISNLRPDSEINILGHRIKTLQHPEGQLLTSFATVNDLHFGETECGKIEGLDIQPILSIQDGETPYPELMARSAVEEIYLENPKAVIAKGDITSNGLESEFKQFISTFSKFGNTMHYVLGNHDLSANQLAIPEDKKVVLNGITLLLINTAVAGKETGALSADTLEFIDQSASESAQPVLVFGHHHPWNPASKVMPENYFGINPEDSIKLVNIFKRRRNLRGYFAGHTHRNRIRYFPDLPNVPFVEVAATKDYPGSWALYKVFETQVIQIHRRISSFEALNWSDKCRALYAGRYSEYAFGELEDRCFTFPLISS